MLAALIIIGFAMVTLGVALLFVGAVPFIGGKRIPAWRSRLIGLVLVSFLPLALGVRQASKVYLGDDAVEGPVVTWVLFGFCWFVVGVILFRVMVPKKAAKPASPVGKNKPFGGALPEEEPQELELIEEEETAPAPKKNSPAQKPTANKAPRPPEENPFDFS